MKKFLSILVSLTFIFSQIFGATNEAFAQDKKPDLKAEYAVLMDYETGKVLYNKNGHARIYPASTTKAWTAYVVIKHVSDLSAMVTIKDLPPIDGSSMYLKNGESFTVKQLLQALLIHSSNDVAYILANYVSGSIDKFVDLMNKEAKAIGAEGTHFNNPHGLPDEKHWTTAYDMALMARQAMSNDVFRDIVNTKSIKFEPNEVYPHERYFINTNKFLTSNEKIDYKGEKIDIKYDIVDGIKTGYTDDAGRCLLSSAVKNDMRLIAAVFKTVGNDLYLDSRTLLDYGFDNFSNTTVINKSDYIKHQKVLFSKQGELIYEPEYSYKVVLPKGTKDGIYTTKIKLDDISLPIKKGDKVGKLEVYNKNKLETTINLVATDDVNSVFSFITENKVVMIIIKFVLLIGIIAFVLFITIKRKSNKNRRYTSIYSNKNKKYKRRR